MVEQTKTRTPVSVLCNLVASYSKEMLCAVVYGSYARGSEKPLRSDSDLDFLLIFKSSANPLPVIKEIEEKFEEEQIHYDIGWFTEEYFIKMLREKVDLCLWWSIFGSGDIIYSEENFLNEVHTALEGSNPLETLKRTYAFRKGKSVQLAQAIVRNLHRIVVDAIWVMYYRKERLQDWNELPSYYKIIENALEKNAITTSVASLSFNLERLRKAMEDGSPEIRFDEIESLSNLTECLADAVLDGKNTDEIDDLLTERAKLFPISQRIKPKSILDGKSICVSSH